MKIQALSITLCLLCTYLRANPSDETGPLHQFLHLDICDPDFVNEVNLLVETASGSVVVADASVAPDVDRKVLYQKLKALDEKVGEGGANRDLLVDYLILVTDYGCLSDWITATIVYIRHVDSRVALSRREVDLRSRLLQPSAFWSNELFHLAGGTPALSSECLFLKSIFEKAYSPGVEPSEYKALTKIIDDRAALMIGTGSEVEKAFYSSLPNHHLTADLLYRLRGKLNDKASYGDSH